MKKILIVEDEFDVRVNLQDLLESESYEVVTAKDGKEGYNKAIEELPDLIISDIKMPYVDGFELYKKLQTNANTNQIPFIFLTAKVEMSDFREGMSLGADDYLIKPFRINDVLKAIEVRLKKRENFVEELEQLRESLLRKVPHELRTPLVGIIGFSELIVDDLENLTKDEIREMITKIKKSGKRLQRRIEKFLAYAELTSSETKQQTLPDMQNPKTEIDPHIVAYKLKPTIEDFDRKNDVEFKIDKGKVQISERYYDMILKELVENALKFSPRGAHVNITGEKNGKYYTTKVKDTGCGIAETSIKEIHALKQFSDEKYLKEGVGLGLALVQKILKIDGGYLNLESKLNESTVVEFGVPLIIE
ncbi:MAG: response regulator [Ignavibacteria bacterium]|nr:response regulator [Ignavibacteria bacterium]